MAKIKKVIKLGLKTKDGSDPKPLPKGKGTSKTKKSATDATNAAEGHYVTIIKKGELPAKKDISKLKQKKKIKTVRAGIKKEVRVGRPSTHGISNTPTYNSARNAKQRCENPNHPQYSDYGGRGIEFRLTVQEVVDEIGLRPIGATLDRIDPDGHYEKGNIQWATRKQQANNRRTSHQYRRLNRDRIRMQDELWHKNTALFNGSVKHLNEKGLSIHESELVKQAKREHRYPSVSFPQYAYADYSKPAEDEVVVPSLTKPGTGVSFKCYPYYFEHCDDLHNRGLIAGLVGQDICLNVTEGERAHLDRYVEACNSNSTSGLCITQNFCRDADWMPERLLMAFAGYVSMQDRSVQFKPMCNLCDELELEEDGEDHGDPTLCRDWLFVPDFQFDAPKGFGPKPWLAQALRKYLRYRAETGKQTIIYAHDPWLLDERLLDCIDDHFIII